MVNRTLNANSAAFILFEIQDVERGHHCLMVSCLVEEHMDAHSSIFAFPQQAFVMSFGIDPAEKDLVRQLIR